MIFLSDKKQEPLPGNQQGFLLLHVFRLGCLTAASPPQGFI
jgi:hypothetical protein